MVYAALRLDEEMADASHLGILGGLRTYGSWILETVLQLDTLKRQCTAVRIFDLQQCAALSHSNASVA